MTTINSHIRNELKNEFSLSTQNAHRISTHTPTDELIRNVTVYDRSTVSYSIQLTLQLNAISILKSLSQFLSIRALLKEQKKGSKNVNFHH